MKTAKFFNAIQIGDINTVKKALEAGMRPDVVNEEGQSAFDIACFYERLDIAELLSNPPPVKKVDLSEEIEYEQDNPVCIVGYSSIFPGSGHSPDDFWQTLSGPHHKMTEVPEERWSVEAHYSSDKKAPGKMYTRHGGFIDQSPYEFDADFFKIVPREVELMDPQQRITLEATWFALENAGINPHELKEQAVGVFCGIMTHDYADMLIQGGAEHNNFIGTGNSASVLSGRVSYFFGFQGPCMTIDTACSSSLVTTHLAMRSLQNGECDLALAGGVNMMLAPGVTINCCKANMLAEDGVCKSFSEEADGYGRGEGVGMLVLKRYKDAMRDGNTIHGIIRGSAVNQDGASSGLTVPNKQAQVQVIKNALKNAGLSPNDIDVIEAHGTGTLLGDPIEINALKEVFAERNPAEQPILINSVKSFIGHLEAAAGVAGIIRILESFAHNLLTALPIYGKLNPKIQLENTRLAILQEKTKWEARENKVRRAGVSSFGFSGTNAHMILEEPPTQILTLTQRLEALSINEDIFNISTKSSIDSITQLLTISAKDEQALIQMIAQYIDWLEHKLSAETPGLWVDVAYSSQTGRSHFPYRAAIQADSLEDCLKRLKQWSPASSMSKFHEIEIQLIVPDLGTLDLVSLQQRYQEDAFFSTLCQTLIKEQSDDMTFVLDYLSGKNNLDADWQLEIIKLIAIYTLYQFYHRIGIQPSQILSQGSGCFLAAVIDGRLSCENMLKLFKAYILKNDIMFAEVKNTIVTYASNSYWKIESEQICEDLYRDNIIDQIATSPLTISLQSGSQTSILNNIRSVYLAGYDLNWRSMWLGSLRQFIQLPLYSFQRNRYQFKVTHSVSKRDQHTATSHQIMTTGYYTSWEPFLFTEQEQFLTTQKTVLLILTTRQSHDSAFIQVLTQSINHESQIILWLTEGVREQKEKFYFIAFDQEEDWQWLHQQLNDKKISRVVDLRYMDIQTEQQELTKQQLHGYVAKRLYQNQLFFQGWKGKNLEHGYVVCFPTGRAVEENIQLCHSGLQGQLRSISSQYGGIISALIEYDQVNNIQTLIDLFIHQIEEVAIKYEKRQWFTQMLLPIPAHHEQLLHVQAYTKKDSVVITGGLGALALTMAMWYAQKGIGHIALIARRQPDKEQNTQFELIANQYNVSIRVYQADVTDAAQLIDAIQQVAQSFIICEVYHLAGKATIQRFDKLTEQDYQDSLAAKVLGAVNLKQALMTLSYWPKQVLLFSSVASLLPESGQTTYAASNCMLDSLAHLSQNTDTPLRVINWGLWGAAGAGADREFVKRIRKGSGILSEMEARSWLDKVLSITYHQVAILNIDWSVYQKQLTRAEKAFVKQLLFLNSKATVSEQSNNQRANLMALNEVERRIQIMQIIKQTVVEVSGKTIDDLQPVTTFEESLSLDSNLLTEIKDILQDKIGRDDLPYSGTLLNDYQSIETLTDFFLTDLTLQKSVSQNSDTPTDYIRQLVYQSDILVKIKLLKKMHDSQEPPLILIHTIMGSVFFYKALVEHLSYTGYIYGIDNPYFSNLAKKFNSIEEMARAYALAIQSQFGNHPVRLSGLSFAGAVAYEVAQQLNDLGVKVDSVLMFDTAMPGAGDLTLPPAQREYVMGEIAEDINEYYQAEIDNNQRILNAYRPIAPKKHLRVILLKARSRDSVNNTLPSLNDLCNGWLNLFCPEVYSVPGSHFSMFDRTYVNTTVQAMRYVYDQSSYFVDKTLQSSVYHNREKLLIQAAKNGDSYLVVRLLKAGVNPLVTDEEDHYAACFSAQHDDLCSLAWIHYYAQGKLPIASLFSWAIQGSALKTMSYLVQHREIERPDEPDITLLMDGNKQQALILYGMSQPYLQREWMQILASHNDSAHGQQRSSAMQILPLSRDIIRTEKKTEAEFFDLMTVTKISYGKFNYEVVTKLKVGKPNKPKLFMFHAASGLALPYTNLDELDFGDVYGVSNPYFGFQNNSGFSSIEEMAQHYIARMKKIQPEGPYYLSGWSLGGIVSQAIASILEQQGETIALVIMIDSVNHSGKPYHPNSEKAAIEKILEGNTSLERYEGVKEAIQRCYLNTSMMLNNYRAKPFSGRVILLKAEEHETNLENDVFELVQWRQKLLDDPFSGWGDLLPNLEIQSVPGNHNDLFDRDYISGVQVQLKTILSTTSSDNVQKVLLSQRWGMNLIKALRRNDARIVRLLLRKIEHDYSYQDALGNLLDAIVASENIELLEKLDSRFLMRLQTSIGSKASDIALENGLLELFAVLEAASASSVSESRNSFFGQSSSNQNSQSKVVELLL